jgi:choline kinase
VTGYLEDHIKDFVSSQYPGLNARYVYNELYASTNNIYSLWLAREMVAGNEMMLMDSDIVFDRNIIAKLLASPHANCLALKKHKVSEEEIKVKADSIGRVLEIGKEIKPNEAMGESIGIERFSAPAVEKLFAIIEKKFVAEKKINVFYEAAFQELIDRGENIFVVDVTGTMCMEIDTAGDLEAAAKMISGYPIKN